MEKADFSASENFRDPSPSLSVLAKKKRNKNNKNNNNNQRRFSDEQIRLLESIFESETKLEPKKKVQLARELGLQPRQVAIWFQNRRARWKSKQTEQDFRKLRAEYDSLLSQFESLKEEKQSLILQLQKLNDLLRKPHDEKKEQKSFEGNDGNVSSNRRNNNSKNEEKLSVLQEGFENRGVMQIPSRDNTTSKIEELGLEEGYHEVRNTSQEVDPCLASPLDQSWLYRFDPCSVYDQSRSGCSQWLNFWS